VDLSTRLTPSAKIALTLALAVYGFFILRDPSQFRLVDNLDLAIHEAGHVFFSPFGEFIGFLGGTLLQLIVPVTFFGYFLHHRNRYAASVLLWWVAQNLWNISVYVRDARAQELPLVGGGEHDWAYLLGTLGVLQRDHAIGRAFVAAGAVCFVVSIAWGLLNIRSRSGEAGGADEHGVM
jgi:hypothetical protein